MFQQNLTYADGIIALGNGKCRGRSITVDKDHPLMVTSKEIDRVLSNEDTAEDLDRIDALMNQEEQELRRMGACELNEPGLNELLTNSLEHGANFGESGSVRIDVYRAEWTSKVFIVITQSNGGFPLNHMAAITKYSKRQIHNSLIRGVGLHGLIHEHGKYDRNWAFNFETNKDKDRFFTLILLDNPVYKHTASISERLISGGGDLAI